MKFKRLMFAFLLLLLSFALGSFSFDGFLKAKAATAVDNYEYKDTYKAQDGTDHTILWVEGVHGPKMTSDEKLLGKPGYFQRTKVKGKDRNYTYYEARYTDGSGYYDINKDLDNKMDKEGEHC